MSKILIEGNKVIIDGHANDLETCNTLTNLCDELNTSDKFRTMKYESGYGEFESISDNEDKKFVVSNGNPVRVLCIYSNDGTENLFSNSLQAFNSSPIEVTSVGVSCDGIILYTYTGDKKFLGLSDTASSTSAIFPVGSTFTIEPGTSNFFVVEGDLGYQVNLQSNDGTTTLAQNATVNSVIVTSTGAQLKCGDTVKVTYTYAGSKLFAGLATSSNATAPEYKPGDTIEITAETTLYIVENIIIPEYHSSLTELFTNIAAVIREKTGDTTSIIADDFPSVIRERLDVKPFKPDGKFYLTFSSPNSFTLEVNDTTKHWNGTLEYFASDRTWSIWDGTTTLSSVDNDGEHVLYLRGAGNTVITGTIKDISRKWVLTGSDISCIGNIENLLDYATVASGGHPTMADFCYAAIFQGCTSLIQAPSLPATTLTECCYRDMFKGCTGLTQAPALPATTLAEGCYYYMFQGCTSLTQAPALPATALDVACYKYMFNGCTALAQVPALPATTLVDGCYGYMFKNCTSLKLSSTQTGEYTVVYRIPKTGTGNNAAGAFNDMFTGTGGTFTGTPSINTTYYLSNTNRVIYPFKIISFTISGISYQAEEGMTWAEWVNSSYNTDGYFIMEGHLHSPDGSGVYKPGAYQQPEDIISNSYSYELSIGN